MGFSSLETRRTLDTRSGYRYTPSSGRGKNNDFQVSVEGDQLGLHLSLGRVEALPYEVGEEELMELSTRCMFYRVMVA